MGDFRVRKINDAEDRRKMYQSALDDIAAFEQMLEAEMFQTDPLSIGAEQELCIVDGTSAPSTTALKILDAVDDPHYTNELALFNLEINLDPLLLKGQCFSEMEKALLDLLTKGKVEAASHGARLLMTGILPTLKYHHLQFEYMTPVQRYQTISKSLAELRGSKFEIYLQGVDEIMMSLQSVLFEACNTSFQLHLQMRPSEFVNQHNWSQMIAGPVLSACVNSPLLFGNELWAETRIALFKQSLDTRSAQKHLRRKLPRVYFGNKWLEKSAAELWKNDLMRFPLIVTSDDFEDARATLKSGNIPDLRAIRLHNGTTYTWNRLCYGYSKKQPHLRIECRYIPSGPTAIDEISNFAFWVGLMKSDPKEGVEFWKGQDFKLAKNNFIKAARTGLSSVFQWYGKNVSSKALILEELLPQAASGLQACNVAQSDIDRYLSVFEKRISAETTGSDWTIRNFRLLQSKYGSAIAEKEIVKQMLDYQDENIPLYEWENMNAGVYSVSEWEASTEELMTKEIFSVQEDTSIAMAQSILEWNNIHHLPVENQDGDLVGMLTDGLMTRINKDLEQDGVFVKDIMLENVVSISATCKVSKAKEIMKSNNLSGLPVVYGNKLVGMFTLTDLSKIKS